MTHVLAERPYRLGWDRAVAARAMRFGWPLLAGGVLTFAVMQGERLIVANQYTATDLGLFSAALTLALAPTLVLLRIVNNMFLPLLARQQDNETGFLNRAELALELLLASGIGLMLVYVLIGPAALRLIYGAEFAAGALLVAILGISSSLRTVRRVHEHIDSQGAHGQSPDNEHRARPLLPRGLSGRGQGRQPRGDRADERGRRGGGARRGLCPSSPSARGWGRCSCGARRSTRSPSP